MMGLTLGEVQRSFSAISHILYGKTWPVGGSTALLKAASSSSASYEAAQCLPADFEGESWDFVRKLLL